jgi:hypothetical protein
MRLPLLPLVLLAGSGTCSAINPGGFPNSLTGPVRGWRSWNVSSRPACACQSTSSLQKYLTVSVSDQREQHSWHNRIM